MRVKILKRVTANIGGKSVQLKEGAEADVPEEAADMLSRAGYAALLDEQPAVKVAGKSERHARTAVKAG